MDKNKLGLRYERLLLLAAPILLISLIVLFIALTSHSDTDQITANCLNSAASEIEKDLPSLTKNWEKGNPSHDKYWAIDYKHAIRTVFIFAHLNPVCNDRIDTELEKHSQKEPKEIVAAFNVEIKKITAQLESRPFKAFGVEIPEKATINILGTNIKISAMVFAQLCQIALTPILILWLGSLYNTRYRETLQIANAKEITEIFPHCINIYLVGITTPLRKKNWFSFYYKKILPYIPTFARITLLSVFIAPPVASYIMSLYFLDMKTLPVLSILAGLIVSIFTFFNYILELLPWHSGAHFQEKRVKLF